jgi:hypothetical protein
LLKKFDNTGDFMIINPSAQTMMPRRNAFRKNAMRRRRQAMSIPGGKQLWFALSKVSCGILAVFMVVSFLIGGSIARVSTDIEHVELTRSELLTANVLLRAQKARLFSPEVVGELADNQLAIHIPASGQYRKF